MYKEVHTYFMLILSGELVKIAPIYVVYLKRD